MDDYYEGKLKRAETKRWSIGDNYEITSGEVIEVKIQDHWITTRIEHNGKDYYAVTPGILLQIGLLARQRLR